MRWHLVIIKNLGIMKTQFERLNRISKVIDLNDFYSISFDMYDIKLQGKYNTKTLSKLKEWNFNLGVNNYLSAKRDNITITLTD
jgi:hypothetical protein